MKMKLDYPANLYYEVDIVSIYDYYGWIIKSKNSAAPAQGVWASTEPYFDQFRASQSAINHLKFITNESKRKPSSDYTRGYIQKHHPAESRRISD